jgi:Fe-S cluster assembly ATP-binding protein
MDINITNLVVETDNKLVLKGLDLNIKKGEIHALMGPNGVGKSTLSKVIMGDKNYKVKEGDILIDGSSILSLTTDERARKGMFLSFQNPISIEGVTNSELLRSALNSRSEEPIGLYEFLKKLEKNTKSLNMDKSMLHRSVNQNFSGGEAKKNEIFQLLTLEPKFIILDELDSGLDVDSLKIVCLNINNYLKEHKDTSVLIITHYPRILEYLKPKYVHILLNGKIKMTKDKSLAKEIEENGYNFILNSEDEVSGDKINE